MNLQLLRELRENITCGFPRIPWGSPDPENPPSGEESFGNPMRMLINCFGSNCCTLWTTCGQAPSVDWWSLWLFMTTAVCVTYWLGVFWNQVTEYQIGDNFWVAGLWLSEHATCWRKTRSASTRCWYCFYHPELLHRLPWGVLPASAFQVCASHIHAQK